MGINRILITNESELDFNLDLLEKKINQSLESYALFDGVELSVLLLGKKAALALNIKYRKRSYIPQMLEFPMSKNADEDGYIHLGDIMICVPLFVKEMKKYHKTEQDVVSEWLAHGIGNLLQ